jgi:hypothetical protein
MEGEKDAMCKVENVPFQIHARVHAHTHTCWSFIMPVFPSC